MTADKSAVDEPPGTRQAASLTDAPDEREVASI
jgi:hypothetical protein